MTNAHRDQHRAGGLWVTRSALITGASRGIGAAIAEHLAADGWTLTLTARNADPLHEVARRLTAAHGTAVEVVPADMGDHAKVDGIVARHTAAHERLDALILNAGMGSIGPFAEFPVRRLDKMLSVNVRSAYALIQHALPALRATATLEPTGAKVVAISSMTGIAGEPMNSAYGASKAALTSLCETLNTEESKGGVTATAICPGYVDTEMTSTLHDIAAAAEMIPVADVAHLVVAVTGLSANVVVPRVAMTRSGDHMWRA